MKRREPGAETVAAYHCRSDSAQTRQLHRRGTVDVIGHAAGNISPAGSGQLAEDLTDVWTELYGGLRVRLQVGRSE